jgi:hypothetical protein
VLDSNPFQRLRHIHQLALSSLVYPGARIDVLSIRSVSCMWRAGSTMS